MPPGLVMNLKSVTLVLFEGAEPVYSIVNKAIEAAVNFFYDEATMEVLVMAIPDEAYNDERGQIEATLLIKALNENTQLDKKDLTIALLIKDMYYKNMNFIFGLADIKRKRIIVSTYRLERDYSTQHVAPVDDLNERVFKEVLHEIGHVFGFEHCPNKSCVMSFSPTLFDVDNKLPLLCEVCRSRLKTF